MGPLILICLLCLGASAASLWWGRRRAERMQKVLVAAERPVAQLVEDAGLVAQEMGPGSFREIVKVRGRVECPKPLTAELSHTPCVSYKYSVTREYEEVLWERDNAGKSIRRVHRRSEVVASNETRTAFWLDDGTGRILVDPERAKLDLVKTHSSFQPFQGGPTSLAVGSFVMNLGAAPGGTLGYRYEEACLPLDQEITVVGEAGDGGGQLGLRSPEASDQPFLVTRNLHDVIRRDRLSVAILKGISLGLAAVAVIIFLLGVVR